MNFEKKFVPFDQILKVLLSTSSQKGHMFHFTSSQLNNRDSFSLLQSTAISKVIFYDGSFYDLPQGNLVEK